jgi:hypothetical protein
MTGQEINVAEELERIAGEKVSSLEVPAKPSLTR